MIWAIMPNTSRTETLLNNLSEADFDLNGISVMMQDMSQRNTVFKDLGPLQGVELNKLEKTLIKLGLSKEGAGSLPGSNDQWEGAGGYECGRRILSSGHGNVPGSLSPTDKRITL